MLEFILSTLHKVIILFSWWSKTATSIEYRLPTIITIVVMVIKFLVNRRVCALDFKKAGVELPCEIVTLSLGFVIIKINSTNETLYRAFVLIVLLVITAALVNYLQREEIINKVTPFTKQFFMCALCYLIAIISFYFSMNAVIR